MHTSEVSSSKIAYIHDIRVPTENSHTNYDGDVDALRFKSLLLKTRQKDSIWTAKHYNTITIHDINQMRLTYDWYTVLVILSERWHTYTMPY